MTPCHICQTTTDTPISCPICHNPTCPTCQCFTDDGDLFLMCEKCATTAAEGIITEVMSNFFEDENNSLH